MAEGNGSGQRLHTDPIMYNRMRRLMDGVVNEVRNAYMARSTWIESAGKDDIDTRRSIFDECGYPRTGFMTPQRWQLLNDRDAIAGRVNEAMAKEAWQVQPVVYEKESGKVVTPTELAIQSVGGSIRGGGFPCFFADDQANPINEVLQRISVMCGVGRYGVVYFGLDDDLPPSKCVRGLEELGSMPAASAYDQDGKPLANKNGTPKFESPRNGKASCPRYSFGPARNYAAASAGRKLGFLRVFPEAQAYVTRWEANKNSPRFGQPVAYRLSFTDPNEPMHGIGLPLSTQEVHWTRVQHVADTFHAPGSSDWWAKPRCEPVLNNILAAQKVYGASGEGYWKAVFTLLFLQTHPQLGGDVDVDDESLKDMMEQMMNGLQRYGILSGMGPAPVAPTINDPTPHLNAQLEAICIRLGMPMRIFKGSERGELASSQDDSAWNDRVKQFELGWITQAVVRPFWDRLITYGVVPRPSQPLKVFWPDITSMSAMEKAQVVQARMTALSTYLNGGGGQAMTLMDFFTKELGLTEEDAASRIRNVMGDAEDAYAEDQGDQLDYVAPESVEGEGEDAPAAEGEPGSSVGKEPPGVSK